MDNTDSENTNPGEPLTMLVKYHDHGYGTFPLKKIAQGDWIDVYAATNVNMRAFTSVAIPLGFSLKLPAGYEAHLAPRSSTFNKWGIIQTNSVGVIDESYCGNDDEWKMQVFALDGTGICAGDKIGQFRIMRKMPEVQFVEVDDLPYESRGGFGSTGSK